MIIGFVHFFVLHLFISFFFLKKKTRRSQSSLLFTSSYGSGYTTCYSIIYITILSVEFSWVVIGSVFYSKYVPDVPLRNFPLVILIYIICSWVGLAFLPALFLVRTALLSPPP